MAVSLILVQGAEADPQAVDGGSVTDRTKMLHEDLASVRVASCSMRFNIGTGENHSDSGLGMLLP